MRLCEIVNGLNMHERPFGGGGGVHTDRLVAALLSKLERSPDVLNLLAYTFIPKSLVRRYASLAAFVREW